MPFLDEVTVALRSGDGGHGCLSFRRERYLPRGGPDGGDGGRGGDLYVVASSAVTTLDDLGGKRHFRAAKGRPGGPRKRHGHRGDDLKVVLPVGTIIRDAERGNVLVELLEDGEEVLLLKGGKGGRGNHAFRSATRQAPRHFETGRPGEERRVRLELRLLADVGLVGLPNAGKSTLLTRISHARPKVGAYAFTTLAPKVGVMEHDFETLTVADLPGLLEGAHQGHGLGDRFLRHIERTKVLVHLVDASEDDLEGLLEAHATVRRELEAYGPQVGAKPTLVVLTKVALRDQPAPQEEFAARTGAEVVAISAAENQGLEGLVPRIFRLVSSAGA